MGQTVNPNIFRLGKTKNWASKYFAKKTSETSIYAFKDLEIRKFIDKFFHDNGLTVSNCKINYLDDGSLHIFVSYYLTFKSVSLISTLNNEQKINFIKVRNKKKSKKNKQKRRQLAKSLRNYVEYQNVKHNELIKEVVAKKNHKTAINSILQEQETLKLRRIRLLESYKAFMAIKNSIRFASIKNSFTTKFFNSLHFFLNKNIKIFLTLNQLNQSNYQGNNKDKRKFFKKNLIKLRKYKQNKFFREGVNILFMLTTQTQKANLLTQFISTHLSKSKKKHNFFLKFVKTTLTLFTSNKFSTLKGIKIKISGRLNGRPRARNKVITIGQGVPIITVNSNLDYAESTAYTSNGTLGVKVWVCHQI